MVMIKCDQCGKEFNKAPNSIKRCKNHFCSKKCSSIYKEKKVAIICDNCGKEFLRVSYRSKKYKNNFCSNKCVGLFKVKSDLEKFMSKVEIIDDKTWIWKGWKEKNGYAKTKYKGKSEWVHRVSYMLFINPIIPKDKCVLHKDDVPLNCCPSNLWLGTKKDNSRDMINKGRGVQPCLFGESHPNSKFLDKQILEIRYLYKECGKTILDLSKKFNVHRSTVERILNNKTWSHI